MPAIQNEYDDYSYIAMRRGTAKAAPRVADSKKRVSTTNKTVKKSAAKTTVRPKATNVSPARMAAAKNANKESVRAVMRDNSRVATKTTSVKKTSVTKAKTATRTVSKSTMTKRKATHNLDVPNVKKKVSSKPQELSLKKADMMKSPKQKANTKTLKKENVVKNTAMFLCMFSMLLLICYRYSVINESFQALGKLEAEVDAVEMLNLQLESDLQKINHEEMEIRAISQGMQKPTESQIQRIYIPKEDRITTPFSFEEENVSSLWDTVVDYVLKWID